jgi:hypothetical protein
LNPKFANGLAAIVVRTSGSQHESDAGIGTAGCGDDVTTVGIDKGFRRNAAIVRKRNWE